MAYFVLYKKAPLVLEKYEQSTLTGGHISPTLATPTIFLLLNRIKQGAVSARSGQPAPPGEHHAPQKD